MLDGKLHRGSQQAETPIQKPVAPSVQQTSNISSSPRGSVKEKVRRRFYSGILRYSFAVSTTCERDA